MTGPSGASRGSKGSRYEAAGGSPTSGVNAVYDAPVVPDQVTVLGDEILPDDGLIFVRGAAPGSEADPRPAGRRGKSGKPPRSWRAAFYFLALAGIVGFAAWALLGSRLLVVRSIVVTGTRMVPRSEVLAAAGVEPGMPLIRVNAGQVAARVEGIRQVRSARVTRSWPDRVVIVVRERTPALAVAAPGGGFDLVDSDGVIVRWAASRPADLPIYPVTVPVASLRGAPDVGAAAAVLGELPAQLLRSVASVTAPSPDQVTLELSGGITVVWGGTDRAAQKAQELTVLMLTHSHYYDVSAQGTLMTK